MVEPASLSASNALRPLAFGVTDDMLLDLMPLPLLLRILPILVRLDAEVPVGSDGRHCCSIVES